MKQLRFFFVLFFIWGLFFNASAQNVVFQGQSSLNNFDQTITTVSGNLIIRSISVNYPIVDLSNLSNITSVGGDLIIESCEALANIDGLEGLTSIGGDLRIGDFINHNDRNPMLENLDGLANLNSVGGMLDIQYNDMLENVDGFMNLDSIGGYLRISGNDMLLDIDGFMDLDYLGGYLVIMSNDTLDNVDGLADLTSVNGDVDIRYNYELTSLAGLAGLTSIEGELDLGYNYALTDLDGLASLASVGGDLKIYNNHALSIIDGFVNLISVGGDLVISGNDGLVNLAGFAGLDSLEGRLSIGVNYGLEDISGFDNLNTIGGDLSLSSNGSLMSVEGFTSLNSVGGSIFLNSDSKLVSIDGFLNLNSIGGRLGMDSNNNLNNVDGFANLTTIGGDLLIKDNEMLDNVDGFANLIFVGGDLEMSGNDMLDNVDGFLNLATVGGLFRLYTGGVVTNLDGFANLSSVAESLTVISSGYPVNCCGIGYLLDTPGAVGDYIYAGDCNYSGASCGNIFVDANAMGNNNGESWLDAFTDLQDALAIGRDTIYIAEGIYLPTLTGTRGSSFDIPENVTLLGGYPSGGGLSNPDLYETILSGNVDHNGSVEGNSYHVVTIKDAGSVELNGITIRDGNANSISSYARSRGGGLYINSSTVKLENVEMKWNRAIYGGAIFAKFSDITIDGSTFKKNKADNGAAFYYSNATNLNLYHSKIIDNTSNVRCALESNNASSTIIENSIFANNVSANANALGFIATNRNAVAQITNSSILGASANKNIISVQVGSDDQMDLTIHNSIVAHQDLSFDKNVVAYNNNVFNFNHSHNYFSGSGIIGNGTNNLFAGIDGDLQLNADYSVANCSPVVNAGSDALAVGQEDIFGNPRFVSTIDIGAYEAQMVCRAMREFQVELAEENHSILVYPNPTEGKIHVKTDLGDLRFTLRDFLGRMIVQSTEKGLDMSHLPKGIYLLNVYNGEELLTVEKIVKE